MSGYVTIECDGEVQVHASAEGSGLHYLSLCGLDGDDSKAGQRTLGTQIGARINCPQCRALIRVAKTYRPRDFEKRP